jgi:hypothetical protein
MIVHPMPQLQRHYTSFGDTPRVSSGLEIVLTLETSDLQHAVPNFRQTTFSSNLTRIRTGRDRRRDCGFVLIARRPHDVAS